MDRPARIAAGVFGLVAALCCPEPGLAVPGVARGRVAVIDSPGNLHGYSTYTGLWTTAPTAVNVARILASDYLGFARGGQKIYCYNSTNDRWIEGTFTGLPLGESVEGATAVFWTGGEMFGISSIWLLWKKETTQLGESVLGGGSAETFGLVWTTRRALAYSSSNGQWIAQQLGIRPAGAIARKGLGLVWTNLGAYAFSASTRTWIDLTLEAPTGVSATGDGQVGLIWSEDEALAYSAATDAWYPLSPGDPILGGSGGGQAGMVWTSDGAHVFDASRSLWTSIVYPVAAGVEEDDAVSVAPGGFAVVANPVRARDLRFRLGIPGSWTVGLYDVSGACVGSERFEVGAAGIISDWNWQADGGTRAGALPAAGIYWLRAESEAGVEARRVVLLPD